MSDRSSAPAAGPGGTLVVRGARTHNLKGVDLTLPHHRLVVFTGVSGSGKSSLAFDTIYAEGQRRYVESLSAYARQFLERMEKPDVEAIEGIAPAIAIRQKNSIRNPRSTVGTTTEIHDYLRLLWARVGHTICRQCGREVVRETPDAVAASLLALPDGTRLLVGFDMGIFGQMAAGGAAEADDEAAGDPGDELPLDPPRDEVPVEPAWQSTLTALRRRGFGRLLLAGRPVTIEEAAADPSIRDATSVAVIVDRLVVNDSSRGRLIDAVETAFREGDGAAFAVEVASDGQPTTTHRFSERFECRPCGVSYEVPQPRLFSFNNPFGACPTCHGFGNVIELDLDLVVPDPDRTLADGAVEPWTKPHYRACLAHLKRAAPRGPVRLDVPWRDLSDAERRFVVEGHDDYEGVQGFFRRLERKKYKVHVRVFLSRYRGYLTCQSCGGTRLRREARDVRVADRTIDAVCALTVKAAGAFFDALTLSERDAAVAAKILREIRRRLGFLTDVGLDYLTLDRLSSTLSGGESQRINLATSLGSALVDTLYVLDEPSIGLHPRDNQRLIAILQQLRDQGNTVLVVEHDADMIRVADHVVDLGLGAGERGGRIMYSGSVEGLLADQHSLTARYLRDELAIPVPGSRRRPGVQRLRLEGAAEHNLKAVDVEVPLGLFVCVTGVSGSGKSTLVHDVLYAAVKRAKGNWDRPVGAFRQIAGTEFLTDAVLVDQQPIGRTPRSNPVTYLKAFDPIRELFAATKDARAKGLTASHFSFNVPGGRCDACEGEGVVRVEMQFLADVFVPCDQCDGKRYKPQVLEVRYKGRNVDQVLDLTVREALTFFGGVTKVVRRLQVLDEIGLGYLRLGQPATTLSGGEAQRIKIASHLGSPSGDRVLYVLDEPTTGLHFDDIVKLLASFRKLIEAGNSLLVIEHNLDVLKTADWIIDLGPDGGDAGGRVVAAGSPEDVAAVEASYTGQHLRKVLARGRAHIHADPV
ncbi:MAG TPA: excinuclease ABC subunit UvrA [Vicinamibacterales bacterium]|nr:excinuclease ABC subunit UvrA [Vicinamibacterales bacterium]